VITIKAHGWQQFLAAFGVLRAAGVEPVAAGGNTMRVAYDTDRGVLRAVAATGAAVYADLAEPAPSVEPGAPHIETPDASGVDTENTDEGETTAENADDSTASDDGDTSTDDQPDTAPPRRRARKATATRARKTKES
jgi:hypothetical protein